MNNTRIIMDFCDDIFSVIFSYILPSEFAVASKRFHKLYLQTHHLSSRDKWARNPNLKELFLNAIKNGNLELTILAFSRRVNIHDKCGEALRLAIENNHPKIIDFLKSKGAKTYYKDVDTIFSWNRPVHYREGLELMDLYGVTLKIDLPRKNLAKNRKFEHIFIDYGYAWIYIYYKNHKSCRIGFGEVQGNDDLTSCKWFSEYYDDYKKISPFLEI
jgi:hypothetical protein